MIQRSRSPGTKLLDAILVHRAHPQDCFLNMRSAVLCADAFLTVPPAAKNGGREVLCGCFAATPRDADEPNTRKIVPVERGVGMQTRRLRTRARVILAAVRRGYGICHRNLRHHHVRGCSPNCDFWALLPY